MRVANVSQEINTAAYTQALLCTESRKTCANMALNMRQSRDALYKCFKHPVECKNEVQTKLIALAEQELNGEEKYLLFDDSQLAKPHAQNIEGVDLAFDGSSGRAELCLQIVTAMITDLQTKLPVSLKPFFSKQIAGKFFKSKSEVAVQIFLLLHPFFVFKLVIADAHYATKLFLQFLSKQKQAFLMKFPCNRIVKIGEKTGQLQKLLRLKRNEHFRCAMGQFDQCLYYFYVVKLNSYTTCYFISLNEIAKEDLVAIYRIRWNIELFHRTAKQLLGWKDCQMRAIEKQVLHSLCVMHAYAKADVARVKLKLETTESAIKMLWRVKSKLANSSKAASMQNFRYAT
jgi:hypothetical protein